MSFVELVTFLAIGFLGMQTLIALFNWITATRMEEAPPLNIPKKVSLLIPVRNEVSNIPRLCEQISKNRFNGIEAIFLDDQSTDGTLEVLEQEKQKGLAIQVIRGKDLPVGWVGKPWACHQLSQEASGDIFIFCDADVAMSPQAIQRTVSWMEDKNLDALTALPFQEMKTWLELAVIPFVMQLSIFGLVPLKLIPRVKSSSLVVANGQWFAITKKTYLAVGGHESVKNSLLEDMELGRKIVSLRFSLLPVLAIQDLKVRMYSDSRSLQEGFTKNLFLLCGGKVWSALGVGVFLSVSFLWPLVGLFSGGRGGALSLGLLLFFRSVVAVSFSASWISVLLHPVGFLSGISLLVRSTQAHLQGLVLWRGRKVALSQKLSP